MYGGNYSAPAESNQPSSIYILFRFGKITKKHRLTSTNYVLIMTNLLSNVRK